MFDKYFHEIKIIEGFKINVFDAPCQGPYLFGSVHLLIFNACARKAYLSTNPSTKSHLWYNLKLTYLPTGNASA